MKDIKNTKPIIETERTYMRPFNLDDYNNMSEMLKDKSVMYAYEHDFTDEDVKEWINKQIDRYEKYNFSPFALILKSSGEFLGQAGLSIQKCEGEDILEIGYLLKRQYWKNGYAFESALACKNYAFKELNAQKVYAMVKWNNIASQNVAKNIGMKKVKEFTINYHNIDMLHYLFECENQL